MRIVIVVCDGEDYFDSPSDLPGLAAAIARLEERGLIVGPVVVYGATPAELASVRASVPEGFVIVEKE